MTELASYYRYWGKADEALKAAYCSGQGKAEIVAKFRSQLARCLCLPESQLQIGHLDQWAEKEDRSRGKAKWVYEQQG